MNKKTVQIKRIITTFDRCVMPFYVTLYYDVIFCGTVLSYITINGLINTIIARLERILSVNTEGRKYDTHSSLS